ncbi:hypothetical protein GY45DRAFT_1331982 [Cubamyces sp. BRFM 1775]|nr:hypothetical protein GY45DRAFT_1331982 [Cubamyces sp. BRFM 1775]
MIPDVNRLVHARGAECRSGSRGVANSEGDAHTFSGQGNRSCTCPEIPKYKSSGHLPLAPGTVPQASQTSSQPSHPTSASPPGPGPNAPIVEGRTEGVSAC